MTRNPGACRREESTGREEAAGRAGAASCPGAPRRAAMPSGRKGRVICKRDGRASWQPELSPSPSLAWQFLSAPFSHVRASLSVHQFPGSGRDTWGPRTAGYSANGHHCASQGDGLCLSQPWLWFNWVLIRVGPEKPFICTTLYSVASTSNRVFPLISHWPVYGSQFTAKETEAHWGERICVSPELARDKTRASV